MNEDAGGFYRLCRNCNRWFTLVFKNIRPPSSLIPERMTVGFQIMTILSFGILTTLKYPLSIWKFQQMLSLVFSPMDCSLLWLTRWLFASKADSLSRSGFQINSQPRIYVILLLLRPPDIPLDNPLSYSFGIRLPFWLPKLTLWFVSERIQEPPICPAICFFQSY